VLDVSGNDAIVTTPTTQSGAAKMEALRTNVETLAAEENKSPLEVISMLQAAAAKTGNSELLEQLCELKWAYLEAA
jgi:hypothetical protein